MKRPWIALAGGAHAALDNSAAEEKGGTHVWGEAAMPPNVLASDADIKGLVDWILALQK